MAVVETKRSGQGTRKGKSSRAGGGCWGGSGGTITDGCLKAQLKVKLHARTILLRKTMRFVLTCLSA